MAVTSTPSATLDGADTRSGSVLSALGWCLISSGDERVRDILVAAAREGGWRTRACNTPEEAIREAVLHRTPLALIDVGSVEDRAKHSDLLRMVRNASDGLVIVCDRIANDEGELWARQEGAWVYLSGVCEPDGVAAVCSQARELAEARVDLFASQRE